MVVAGIAGEVNVAGRSCPAFHHKGKATANRLKQVA